MKLINILAVNAISGILPSITDVLLHMLNLIILAIGLYFLIFKKIKKKMVERQENIKKIEDENTALNEEVKKMKDEYESILQKARDEAIITHDNAIAVANKKTTELIYEARQKAKEIIEKTEKDLTGEKVKLEEDIKQEITVLSLEIAEKIIKKELTKQDNDKIIDESLAIWSK